MYCSSKHQFKHQFDADQSLEIHQKDTVVQEYYVILRSTEKKISIKLFFQNS